MDHDLIVVGNGEDVLKKKNGSLIDSFNTVVRLGSYVTKGYEEYVGSKTDIISTIYWKLNIDRLKTTKVILNVPIHYQENFTKSEEFISKEYSKYEHNILYLNKEDDIKGIIDMYTKFMPPFNGIEDINFSLGFKTFYFIKKLFPEKKIYTTGFDFFKTGWYWDPSHNRDDNNMHPYTWERLWYAKMKSLGNINEI